MQGLLRERIRDKPVEQIPDGAMRMHKEEGRESDSCGMKN